MDSNLISSIIAGASAHIMLSGVVIILVLYNILKCVYRLWFHPLASYPGPFLARISPGWAFYHAGKLRKAHAIQDAHEKYGPIVRVAPDQLSFNDPSALKAIYGHGAGFPKTMFYDGGHFTANDNLFSQRDKARHSGRRSMLAKAFSPASLTTHLPIIQGNVECAFDHWSRMSNNGETSVDIYHWIHWIALDVIFVMILGVQSGILVKGEDHPHIRDLESFIPGFAWMAICPPLRYYGTKVPIKAIRKPFQLVKEWIEWTLDAVRSARQQEKGTRTPLMERLLEDTDRALGRPLKDLEIVEEMISFFFAGSGTTANTIVFLIWSVLRDPQIHDKLVAELREAFPDPDQMIDVGRVNDLPYTNAVIMEALRKYPVIPGMQPRYVLDKDILILGNKIPKGSGRRTIAYTDVFPDPETFQPDRWLGTDKSTLHQAFNGFGTGPRACIGQNLAMLEMKAVIPAFFIRFDAKIAPDFPASAMFLTDGFVGGPAGESLPLMLQDRRVRPKIEL